MSRLDFTLQLSNRGPGGLLGGSPQPHDVISAFRGGQDLTRLPDSMLDSQCLDDQRSSSSSSLIGFEDGDVTEMHETLLDRGLIAHPLKEKLNMYEQSLGRRSPITIHSLTTSGGLKISGNLAPPSGYSRKWHRNAQDVSLAAVLSPTTSQWLSPGVTSSSAHKSPNELHTSPELNLLDDERETTACFNRPTLGNYPGSPPTSPTGLVGFRVPETRLGDDSFDFMNELKTKHKPTNTDQQGWCENTRRRYLSFDPVFSSPFDLNPRSRSGVNDLEFSANDVTQSFNDDPIKFVTSERPTEALHPDCKINLLDIDLEQAIASTSHSMQVNNTPSRPDTVHRATPLFPNLFSQATAHESSASKRRRVSLPVGQPVQISHHGYHQPLFQPQNGNNKIDVKIEYFSPDDVRLNRVKFPPQHQV